MQSSNEGLTTAPGSPPVSLWRRAESDSAPFERHALAAFTAGRQSQALAAMKIDSPNPVR